MKNVLGTLKASNTFLCVCAYASLFIAYYLCGEEPSWVSDIDWIQNLNNGRFILFSLEFLTLTFVTFLSRISPKLPHVDVSFIFLNVDIPKANLKDNPYLFINTKPLRQFDYLFTLILFTLVSLYAVFKIVIGENIGIRISYSAYAFFLLIIWLYVGRILLTLPFISLFKILASLVKNPLSLFTVGRNLPSSLNSIAVSVSVVLLPAFTILPTLPVNLKEFNLSVNQRAVVSIVGIFLCLIVLLIYLYVQVIISNALNRSFQDLDIQVENNIVRLKTPQLDDAVERINSLISVRDSLVKSIRSPAGISIFNAINITVILVAFINIALAK